MNSTATESPSSATATPRRDHDRDRDGSFEPKIVAKRQKRLTGVDEMVISLAAKGLTTGEISAHLAEVYGAQVSRQTISTITEKVMEGMAEWQNRPLDCVYPVIFIDAIHVKIRDGKVTNRPVYVALAVTCEPRPFQLLDDRLAGKPVEEVLLPGVSEHLVGPLEGWIAFALNNTGNLAFAEDVLLSLQWPLNQTSPELALMMAPHHQLLTVVDAMLQLNVEYGIVRAGQMERLETILFRGCSAYRIADDGAA
jgi:hypothetical protein